MKAMKSQTNKWLIIIGCLLLTGIMLFGCGPSPAATPATTGIPSGFERIKIAGGSIGSSGLVAATACAKVLNQYYPEIQWSSRSGVVGANGVEVVEGTTKVAMLTPPTYIESYGSDYSKSRWRMIINPAIPSQYIWLMPEDKPWKDLSEVPKGTVLSYGPPATASEYFALTWVKAIGRPKDYYNWLVLGADARAGAWRDRKIDITMANVNVVAPYLIDMYASGRHYKLLGLTSEQAEKGKDLFMQAGATSIEKVTPGKAFPDLFKADDSGICVATPYALAVRDDFPDQIAYKMAKIFDEHRDDLVAISASYKDATPENTLKYAVPPLALHPAVAKYYREKGYLK